MMLENQLVSPCADDNAEMVTMPDGLTVIRKLSNYDANNIIADHIHETAQHGRPHLQVIFDTALQTDAHRRDWCKGGDEDDWCDYQTGLRKTLLAIIQCATEAGESDIAQDQWLEDQRECE